MILVYGKGKVGKAVKDLLDFLKIENKIVDDFDGGVDYYIKNESNIDLIVPSPGIKPSHDIYTFGKEKIIGEIDLVNSLIEKLNLKDRYFFVGITGTDGKSTTTWKVYNILKKYLSNCYDIFIGGNFDKPVSNLFLESLKNNKGKKNIFVLEVSSFMGFNLKKTNFLASFWTNFSVDHLDWHKDLNEYWDSKMNLFKLTPVLKFPKLSLNQGYEFFNTGVEDLVTFLQNLLKYFNINISSDELIKDLEKVKPLPHRFQLYKKVGDINIFDDGKCTTAQCQRYALKNLDGKCILIAGGFDKGIDYSINKDIYKQKVVYGIFFGDIGKKLANLFDDIDIPNRYFDYNFKEAVLYAFDIALQNKIFNILFSPGASSFDMFSNRKERAEEFLKIINKLDEKNKNIE